MGPLELGHNGGIAKSSVSPVSWPAGCSPEVGGIRRGGTQRGIARALWVGPAGVRLGTQILGSISYRDFEAVSLFVTGAQHKRLSELEPRQAETMSWMRLYTRRSSAKLNRPSLLLVPVRRVRLRQGPKIRPIGDFSGDGHNATLALTSKFVEFSDEEGKFTLLTSTRIGRWFAQVFPVSVPTLKLLFVRRMLLCMGSTDCCARRAVHSLCKLRRRLSHRRPEHLGRGQTKVCAGGGVSAPQDHFSQYTSRSAPSVWVSRGSGDGIEPCIELSVILRSLPVRSLRIVSLPFYPFALERGCVELRRCLRCLCRHAALWAPRRRVAAAFPYAPPLIARVFTPTWQL